MGWFGTWAARGPLPTTFKFVGQSGDAMTELLVYYGMQHMAQNRETSSTSLEYTRFSCSSETHSAQESEGMEAAVVIPQPSRKSHWHGQQPSISRVI